MLIQKEFESCKADQCEDLEGAMVLGAYVLDRKAATRAPNWYAVYVKSRHEFVAACELVRKGMETFLPTATKLSQWQDRKKLIKQPLFPGYIFVHALADPEEYLKVLKTRGVVSFISLEPGFPTPIIDEEINSLRLLIGSGIEIDIYPQLKQGMRVRVKSGPLENAEGVLIKKKNDYLFQVNIELLGRSLAVKISPREIEAL